MACKELKQVLLERQPLNVIQSRIRAEPLTYKALNNPSTHVEKWFLDICGWKLPEEFLKAVRLHLQLNSDLDVGVLVWASTVYEVKICGIEVHSMFYERVIKTEAGFKQLLDAIAAPADSSIRDGMQELNYDSQVREHGTF